jgi:hypothetical protein
MNVLDSGTPPSFKNSFFKPMPDLTTTQLETIQRLLSEPLRQAVRAEMQAGHERLAAAIEKVAEQLAAHISESLRRERARDGRIDVLETRVAALERFRGRVLLVYAALSVILSIAWSIFREWIASLTHRR